jgi:hypothetical protein
MESLTSLESNGNGLEHSNNLAGMAFTSEDILHLLVDSPIDNKKFVPADSLERAVTIDRVISTFEVAGISPISRTRLAQIVIDKGKRTFATLVFTNKVCEIESLLNEGFTDNMLPVAYEASHDVWTVRSYQPDSDNTKADTTWTSFNLWTKSDIYTFCERQWMFLAPVFRGDQFRYFLHRDIILPFMWASDKRKQSSFSTVYQAKIHISHQKALPMVSNLT